MLQNEANGGKCNRCREKFGRHGERNRRQSLLKAFGFSRWVRFAKSGGTVIFLVLVYSSIGTGRVPLIAAVRAGCNLPGEVDNVTAQIGSNTSLGCAADPRQQVVVTSCVLALKRPGPADAAEVEVPLRGEKFSHRRGSLVCLYS